MRGEQASASGVAYASTAPEYETFPEGEWHSEAGFDSGLFAVDKLAVKSPLARLRELTFGPADAYWRNRSMGDKDLWKLSFILTSHNYSLSPTPGIVGYFDPKAVPYPRLSLVSLALGHQGQTIALHQNRDGGCAGKRCAKATVDLRKVPWIWDPSHLDPLVLANYGVLLPIPVSYTHLTLPTKRIV